MISENSNGTMANFKPNSYCKYRLSSSARNTFQKGADILQGKTTSSKIR